MLIWYRYIDELYKRPTACACFLPRDDQHFLSIVKHGLQCILSERWAEEKNLIEFEFHRTNNDQQRNELTMIQRAIIAEYKYCKRIKANPTKFIEHKNDILGKRSTSLYRSENRFINEIIPKSVSFLSICFFSLSLAVRMWRISLYLLRLQFTFVSLSGSALLNIVARWIDCDWYSVRWCNKCLIDWKMIHKAIEPLFGRCGKMPFIFYGKILSMLNTDNICQVLPFSVDSNVRIENNL